MPLFAVDVKLDVVVNTFCLSTWFWLLVCASEFLVSGFKLSFNDDDLGNNFTLDLFGRFTDDALLGDFFLIDTDLELGGAGPLARILADLATDSTAKLSAAESNK